MDWLLRPVVRGYVAFESLLDGKVDLEHISLLNDAIDLEDENRRRAEAKLKSK